MISVFVINYAYIYTLTKQSTKLFLLWYVVSFSFSLLCFVTFSSNFVEHQRGKKEVATLKCWKKRTNKQTNKNIKHIHDDPPPTPRFTLSKKNLLQYDSNSRSQTHFVLVSLRFHWIFLKSKRKGGGCKRLNVQKEQTNKRTKNIKHIHDE